MSDRAAIARASLGEAGLYCPTEAADLYGGRRAELVAEWRRAGIIRKDPRGAERVLWKDVIRWSRGEISERPGPRTEPDPWASLPEYDPA